MKCPPSPDSTVWPTFPDALPPRKEKTNEALVNQRLHQARRDRRRRCSTRGPRRHRQLALVTGSGL
jgi:hypothetical protein